MFLVVLVNDLYMGELIKTIKNTPTDEMEKSKKTLQKKF
jgi:hypothetical protein